MIVLDSAGFVRQPHARSDSVPVAPTPGELDPDLINKIANLLQLLRKNHLPFSICNFRFVIEERALDPISSNHKSKITNGKW
jgi:hypothetical protein